MDDWNRSWFELQFKDMVHQKTGMEYQDFFVSIMTQCYPEGEFVPVVPWGREGDQKCDGYFLYSKTVFQVYAPNDLGEAETIAKIGADFRGAVNHWNTSLRGWTFVHNSYRGVSARVAQTISALEQANPGIVIAVWGPYHLWTQMCETLPQSKFETLLGFPPSREGMDNLDFDLLQSILDRVAKMAPSDASDLRPVPPDKIQINCLSSYAQKLLEMGLEQVKQVERCLDLDQDPRYGDRLAAAFSKRYLELRQKNLSPDDILVELWRFAGGPDILSAPRTCCILAVIAYLFERCGIFERTSREATNL